MKKLFKITSLILGASFIISIFGLAIVAELEYGHVEKITQDYLHGKLN